MEVSDLSELSKLARKHGALSIVDSTFASPMACQPLNQGFDIVLHSVTKILNGHSDLLGGVIASRQELIDQVWYKMRNFGGAMDPHQASLLERGLKTLDVRYKKSTETAGNLANWLSKHPKIVKVIYPGLDSHNDYELCKKKLQSRETLKTKIAVTRKIRVPAGFTPSR